MPDIDWNDAAKDTIVGALGMVPEVGEILGGLLSLLWPGSKRDIWAEIKQKVENLVNEKISQEVYNQVSGDLEGLKDDLTNYQNVLKTSSKSDDIRDAWQATYTQFLHSRPHFREKPYEVPLLPMFAQFVNLHLSLMRDCVLFGKNWGYEAGYVKTIQDNLTATMKDSTTYAICTYNSGYDQTVMKTQQDDHKSEPFRAVNAYVRQMTLTVLDFSELWKYLDPSLYPTGKVDVELNHEIYSDPVGTCDDSGPIALPGKASRRIKHVTVWGWDRIDAVQVTYPERGGPGGVTQTARMGDDSGGSNQPPHGCDREVDEGNPIVSVSGNAGNILHSLALKFRDGSETGTLGGAFPGGEPFKFEYPGYGLSSIHINGISRSYGSADCAVFGFRRLKDGRITESTTDDGVDSAGAMIEATGLFIGGVYRIKSSKSPDLCLAIYEGKVLLKKAESGWGGDGYQRWRLVYNLPQRSIAIVNESTNQRITGTQGGRPVRLEPWASGTGGDASGFTIRRHDQSWWIRRSADSDTHLEVTGDDCQENAVIELYGWNNGQNQHFLFETLTLV